MQFRLTINDLLNTLSNWDSFLRRTIHLIACGGTAMTLLGIKPSTKDIDFLIPIESEYDYLIKILKSLGYEPITGVGWSRGRGDDYVFDLFRGKRVHTTELLESPLEKGNHILIREFSHIYLGVLNYYDIIISKLFRAASIDVEDCLALIKAKKEQINISLLKNRFRETASYEIAEDKVNKNLDYFLKILEKEKLYGE